MSEKPQKKRIGDQLIDRGVISLDQLKIALQEQQQTGNKIGKVLIDLGFLTESLLTDVLGESRGDESINLSEVVPDAEAISLIDKKLAQQFKVLPCDFDPETKVLLIDAEGTWAGGIDLPKLVPYLDGILHCVYETEPARISPLLAQSRALLGPDKTLIAGFQLFHPIVRDQSDLVTRVVQAAPHDDGSNFYNLGLVPSARMKWISAALEASQNCVSGSNLQDV